MKRRQFISLVGGAAVWPLAARAQQRQAMPVVGFLSNESPATSTNRLRAFHEGLKEAGYVEGDTVAILYRFAEAHPDRLPALAADLVRRRIAVLASFGTAAGLAAKAATTTIPIVFAVSEDPVRLGLVANLARPGSNATGYNFLATELAAKRLELLRQLVPRAANVAVLLDPVLPQSETILRQLEVAAPAMGLKLQVLKASTSGEINAAFAALARERPDALFVEGGALFDTRRVQLVQLASRHAIPASYSGRESIEIGGLMSYGPSITEQYRQIGAYTGRILKGAKPADLPVVQSSKFELVINAETARLLDLAVPPQLLAIADEVIE
jgi:putative tryptophan/tyrosine transport system substrate-binding protein